VWKLGITVRIVIACSISVSDMPHPLIPARGVFEA